MPTERDNPRQLKPWQRGDVITARRLDELTKRVNELSHGPITMGQTRYGKKPSTVGAPWQAIVIDGTDEGQSYRYVTSAGFGWWVDEIDTSGVVFYPSRTRTAANVYIPTYVSDRAGAFWPINFGHSLLVWSYDSTHHYLLRGPDPIALASIVSGPTGGPIGVWKTKCQFVYPDTLAAFGAAGGFEVYVLWAKDYPLPVASVMVWILRRIRYGVSTGRGAAQWLDITPRIPVTAGTYDADSRALFVDYASPSTGRLWADHA